MTGEVRQFQQKPPHQGAQGGNGGGHDLPGHVAAIEAHMAHLATKNEVTNLKVWILGGVLSGIVLAAGIAAAIVRVFA